MSLKTIGKFSAAAACALTLTSVLSAHIDDPKAKDRLPMYTGPGYRAADDAGNRGGPNFPSSNITLMSWITIPEFAGNNDSANDCWGYVSGSGREYALLGLSDGTAFIDITDPGNPVIRDYIAGPGSLWRDVKTYQNYAYSVSEGGGGIQVFDLSNIDTTGPSLVTTVTTGGSAKTHNVAINTDSGYLYRCGGQGNGLRIYSLSNPANPTFVASWPDRYVHDAQIVTLDDGQGGEREIAICCSGFNNGSVETGIDILDVTNKSNIINLARYQYSSNAEYSHQAWLSPDNRYLYLNDELDEGDTVGESTMYVIDLQDLENPVTVNTVGNGSPAITHNIYTRDQYVYAANYTSGIRIFDATDPVNPFEAAYFDTFPANDQVSFNSLWSVYPYFPSGTVIGSDIEQGLFVWQITLNQLAIDFPTGTPAAINPDGSTIEIDISNIDGTLDPSSATLFFDAGDGQGYMPIQLTSRGGSQFEAAIPSVECGREVSYYVSAETTGGVVVTDPANAPTSAYHALSGYDIETVVDDDFNTDNGWVATNLGATSGDWQRGTPVNDPSWDYDPTSDADGSGQCWLTQNQSGNTDVDNGAVQLVSAPLDLTNSDVVIAYDYFLRITDNAGNDMLLVEISSNGDAGPWTEITRHDTDGGLNWRQFQIDAVELASLGVNLTSDMRLRFRANDADPQSIVEAGIDGFSVRAIDCDPPDTVIGDLNDDQLVNIFDLLLMLDLWGECGQPCPPSCAADIADSNGVGSDCTINIFDLLQLLDRWTG